MRKNTIRSHRYLLLLALAAVAGLVAGLALVQSLLGWPFLVKQADTNSPASLASFLPPPKSMEELASKAEVIVVGRVGPIVNQGAFAGYDAAGNIIPSGTGGRPGIPITDFQVDVERVFKDNGTLRAGNPLILRMLGHPTNQAARDADRSYYPMSYTGDRHLFFLSKNPDTTYGFYYGPWSRLVIDGQLVTASDGMRTPVRFGGRQFPPAEFIASLTQSIQ